MLKTVAGKGTRLAEAPVWMGSSSTVGLVPSEDVQLLLPAGATEGIRAEAVFDGPARAPFKAGDALGQLVIHIPGIDEPTTVPLVAEHDVTEGGFLVRMRTAAAQLFSRAAKSATDAAGS